MCLFETLLAISDQNIQPVNVATGEFYWDDGETWVDPESDFSDVDYYHFTYNFTYSAFSASLDINLVKMPKASCFQEFGLMLDVLRTVWFSRLSNRLKSLDICEEQHSKPSKLTTRMPT